MNSSKSLIFDLTKIPLTKRLILINFFNREGYALSATCYRIEIELFVFKLCLV